MDRTDFMHDSVKETLKQLFAHGFTVDEVGVALLAHGTRLMLSSGRPDAVLEVIELMNGAAWAVTKDNTGH